MLSVGSQMFLVPAVILTLAAPVLCADEYDDDMFHNECEIGKLQDYNGNCDEGYVLRGQCCQPKTVCPPGKEKREENKEITECDPCPQSTFNNGGLPACIRCSVCINRVTLANCTSTNDTRCGRCHQGFMPSDSYPFECFPAYKPKIPGPVINTTEPATRKITDGSKNTGTFPLSAIVPGFVGFIVLVAFIAFFVVMWWRKKWCMKSKKGVGQVKPDEEVALNDTSPAADQDEATHDTALRGAGVDGENHGEVIPPSGDQEDSSEVPGGTDLEDVVDESGNPPLASEDDESGVRYGPRLETETEGSSLDLYQSQHDNNDVSLNRQETFHTGVGMEETRRPPNSCLVSPNATSWNQATPVDNGVHPCQSFGHNNMV